MPENLFEKHKDLLDSAVRAIETRGYWSPFPESPSPKIYGENANEDGKRAFESLLHKPFAFKRSHGERQTGSERSPFGMDLGITYPAIEIEQFFAAIEKATPAWRKAGPEAWVGLALETLVRLNKMSFEMAYAVMHTTGQAFTMSFQAGGPHAQDRGLEAVAYAWSEMNRIPKSAVWEKPQGKGEPLRMEKQYRIVPRGVGLVIGCCTFPTWNSYPGLFASLATGNAVIVKPHPGAILPLALTVKVAGEVLAEAGFDPNLVTLVAHNPGDPIAQELALRPEVKIIDFTGSTENGCWLEKNARQANVYAEKAGVNPVVIDSTSDLKGMARNLAFSLALYSGQMCTAPQNIYVPEAGIDTPDGLLSFDQVTSAIAEAVEKSVSDPGRAVELLGAVQNEAIARRIDEARRLGEVLVDSKSITHPQFTDARIRTPLVMKVHGGDRSALMREWFGPISFVISTASTAESLQLAKTAATEHGALTMSVYSQDPQVLEAARDMAADAGVSLSCNLTGGVFVNQSAAYSDYHGTGANPAANASLTDTAFVANRFRVAQSRAHI